MYYHNWDVSWLCLLSNYEGKTEPPQKTGKYDEPQVMANLINLRVIKILLDCHAVLIRGL